MRDAIRSWRGSAACLLLLPGLVFSPLPALAAAQQDDAEVPAEPPVGLEPAESDGIPLTLREVLALAMDSSLAIAVQRYEPTVSGNSVLFERGAFDPNLNLLGQYQDNTSLSLDPFTQSVPNRQDEISVGQVSFQDFYAIGGNLEVTFGASKFETSDPQFLINPIYNSSLTFTYNQSLLRNFGYDVNTTGIRVAQRNVDISESQFRQTVIDTIQGVEKAYWDLKFALEDLAVKRHSLALSEQTLDQNKIRVDVGTMAPIDVTTAEAEVASREQDVLLAENALENAEDTLLLFLNQPKTSPLWVMPINPVDELPFDASMTIDLEAAIAQARAHRPDLEQVDLRIQNDEDLVARARDQMRWDLNLRATYSRAGIAGDNEALCLDNPPPLPGDPCMVLVPSTSAAIKDAAEQIVDEDFDSWSLTLNLNIPLLNKSAKANYLSARLRQIQRREIYDSAELDAVIEVRNRARAVENAVERVEAARVNVRLQRERLAAENKRYENGMTTTFDLFQFQDDLTRAESQVIAALVDYNKALADLEAAKGTLAQTRGVRFAELIYDGEEGTLDSLK